MQRIQGFVQNGNVTILTGGLSSSNVAMGSFPLATLTVNITGGGLATIFSDNIGTPLANPFTSTSTGYFEFYAANGRYDIQFSGGGLSAPITFGDNLLDDPASAQPIVGTTGSFSGNVTIGGTLGVTGLTTVVNESVTGTLSVTGATTLSSAAASGAITAQSIDGVLQVGTGAGQFSSMAAAYAAASVGQTIEIAPGWTETFAASLTMNKNSVGFLFRGSATISMGAFQIIFSPGVNGAFIRGTSVSVLIAGITPIFTYNGNAEAIKVGTSAANTQGIILEHFAINLTQGGTPAGAAAIGLRLNSTIVSEFTGVSIYCQANGHIGLLLDGTGNFTGNNHFKNMNIGLTGGLTATCIKLSNASTINEFENTNLVSAGGLGTGIDMTTGVVQSNQFNVINTEAFAIAMTFGANAVQNRATSAFFETNTTDIAWGTSANNRVQVAQASPANIGAGPIVTDGGSTGNTAEVIGGTLLNVQGQTGVLTGNSADQTFFTYTVPARIIGPGKGVRIRVWFSTGAGADTPTIKLNFGSMALFNGASAGTTQSQYMEAIVFNNSGVTNAQSGSTLSSIAAVFSNFSVLVGAVDTTAAVAITATFNISNTHTLRGQQFLVELIQ